MVDVGADGGVFEALLRVVVLLAGVGLAANRTRADTVAHMVPKVIELLFAYAPKPRAMFILFSNCWLFVGKL